MFIEAVWVSFVQRLTADLSQLYLGAKIEKFYENNFMQFLTKPTAGALCISVMIGSYHHQCL